MKFFIEYGVKGGKTTKAIIDASSQIDADREAASRAVGIYDTNNAQDDEPIDIGLEDENFDDVVDEEINRKIDKLYHNAEPYDVNKHGKYEVRKSKKSVA